MMNVTKISVTQVFALQTLFLMGSSIVIGLNLGAEENAWLVNLMASAFGLLLFFFYMLILKKNGWPEFHQLLENAFGKIVGKVVLFLYSMYFFYIAGRVIKDFVYFISQTLFYNIDNWIVAIASICLVGYSVILGLEAVARTSEILLSLTFLLLFIIAVFAYLSGVLVLENIRPLLDIETLEFKDWIQYLTFPYGELVVFLTIYPFINDHKKLVKKGWIAVLLSGLVLIGITEIIIAILGAKVASFYTFPLVKAIEMIELLGIVQHLEILSAVTFVIVGFIKVVIFLIAGAKGVTYLLPALQEKFIIVVLCAIIYISTFYIGKNLPEHIHIGLKFVPIYMHVPFQFIIPLIILALTWFKMKGSVKA
ncbi:endospore germination permease [Bacillus sp. THAF10]|uniref:GerAB/ArcD/ProY family transporter n=1 Tax=Bacillus sp. THAF10 TaxID=2587848 RepID=UPI0012693BE9|nr:endospore germination permease [Bacillus sp. THAF10]